MLISDIQYLLTWWIFVFVLGIIFTPTVSLIFKKFTDLGFGFSKIFSIVIFSYLLFIITLLRIMPFAGTTIFILFAIFTFVNLYLLIKNKQTIFQSLKQKAVPIIFQELLFLFGLVFWSYVRGQQPNIEGLEKFMDYGFINSLLKTKYLPPIDMWFSGSFINYYWFGHFITAFITKATNIPSAVSYNLMLATIMGLTLSGAFSLISTLTNYFSLTKVRVFFLAGIISAAILVFGGNFHTPFYVLKDGSDKYWYPDATRFIGYNPDTNDKTIHEFPQYSFVVADLHAHVLNLPIVILFISILWIFFEKYTNSKKLKIPIELIILGFLLGVMFMTSTWDFGNYLILSAVSLFALLILNKKTLPGIINILILGLILVLSGVVFASPFIIYFKSIAQGIDFVHAHTPIWQLAVLWGFPVILTVIMIINILKLLPNGKKSDYFVACMLITSIILIIIPEVFFVKDIYIASHHRANTMFKLTYQAFVLSYLAGGYTIVRSLSLLKTTVVKLLAILFYSIILVAILIYPKFTIKSYYGKLAFVNYKGLSGETWLKEQQPDTYYAIDWLRKNTKGQPVILEAPGDSYTTFNVISSYTGLPTVSGWFVHEWLWRGDASFPQLRVSDIDIIYTSDNIEDTKTLLKKYGVRYVIIGSYEYQKFPNLNKNKFINLGRNVLTLPTLSIFEIY